MSIDPYTISVPDDAITSLRQRLSSTSFPEQLDGADVWKFGTPVADVKKLVEYWKDGFDWGKAEVKLNQLPNFRTSIDVEGFGDIEVHFVHQVNPNRNAIPLLFCHGWPGSFAEVTKLLPLLEGDSKSNTPAFHVVAPSLPNFGFSSGINRKGFNLTKYAETLNKLMLKLGYKEYVTQAGDWGFSITRTLALLYPSHCLATHINLILANPPSFSKNSLLALRHALTPYTTRETAAIARSAWFAEESYGYNLLQSTKPQTISFALTDSPVALLAWIYEKLHTWTDSYAWTPDEILTWVSIYWFSTAGPAASVRIYYEATRPQPESDVTTAKLREYIPKVKLGVGHFPKEINCVPKLWVETMGPVVWQGEHQKGGHFAAWEVPEAVVRDLRGMFGKGGPCEGIVKGKGGY